jgi:hypothetical protein
MSLRRNGILGLVSIYERSTAGSIASKGRGDLYAEMVYVILLVSETFSAPRFRRRKSTNLRLICEVTVMGIHCKAI